MTKKRMIHEELERREKQMNLQNEIDENKNIHDSRLIKEKMNDTEKQIRNIDILQCEELKDTNMTLKTL